jgi:hypothetical protein
MSEILIYQKENIDELVWEKYENGQKAKDYFYPLMIHSTSTYIRNVQTEVKILAIDHLLIPFTINHQEYENSYVCSPYNHYITYAKEEVSMLKKPLLEKALKVVIDIVGLVTKLVKINQVIYLNNWLISTNLSPSLNENQIERIKNKLLTLYPNHLLGYRSMNECLNKEMIGTFETSGFLKLPSRFVYISTPEVLERAKKKVRNTLRRDQQLLNNPSVEVIGHEDFTREDLQKAGNLYRQLYLDKYSYHNPQFTEEYIKKTHETHSLHYMGVKVDGVLEGVMASKIINGVMANPIVGYNTALPLELGLYRMIRFLALQESIKHQRYYHQSAGVGRYKYDRGALGFPEYTMIYCNHLSGSTRIFWKALCYLLNSVGIKLVEKNRL